MLAIHTQHTGGRRNIATISPNRVNRAHWPTKENKQNLCNFWILPAHAKNGPRWPQMGQEDFFLANPDLADILGRMDFVFENFDFWIFFGSQILRFPDSLAEAWAGLGPGLGQR